jgi:hypothetical protein
VAEVHVVREKSAAVPGLRSRDRPVVASDIGLELERKAGRARRFELDDAGAGDRWSRKGIAEQRRVPLRSRGAQKFGDPGKDVADEPRATRERPGVVD